MNKYAVINLKTDPELKKTAAKVAHELGISISTVLNNELRRFSRERRVVFETTEVPNERTVRLLKKSRKEIEKGEYHRFDTPEESEAFLQSLLS